MIFQLIIRDVQWYQYLVNAFLAFIGRSLDILSTRYVSKELKLETNRIAQRVGWRGMILMQIPIIILGSLDFYFSFFILWWSILIFANNIEGSWYIKEVGEDRYHQELETRVKKSKTWKIIFSELSPILQSSVAGIFIIIFLFILKDLLMVFLICLSLIIQGILGMVSSVLYLIKMKKEKIQIEEQ
ncbi:MAG: hypothetical protein ACFFHD_08040 [Promethearchaeota archaeon]